MQKDPKHPECDSGVDLNRNYGFQFGEGASSDPCSEMYNGPHPFSAPETINMRDFLTSKKDEIKFVYNLHSSGDMFFLPFQGKYPNDLMTQSPFIHQVFSEIVQEADLPKNEIIGAAPEVLYPAGGDSGDWITFALHIPAAESEIGKRSDMDNFTPKSIKLLEKTVK